MFGKVVIVAVFCVLFAASVFGDGRSDNKLSLTLNQALDEMIADGTYENIMNDALGAGNWVYPSDFLCTKDTAWKNPTGDDDDSLQTVLASGILSVGSVPSGPLAGGSASNPSIISSGFEVSISNELARRLASHYDTSVIASVSNAGSREGLWTGLDDGVYDIVMGGSALTVARAAAYQYSCEYFSNDLGYLRTNKDPLVLVDGVNDANNDYVEVGVLEGSTGYDWAMSNLRDASVTVYPSWDELARAAVFQDIHVAIADFWEIQAILDSGYCLGCRQVPHNLDTSSYRFWTIRYSSSAGALGVSVLTFLMAALFLAF